jgi:hypothetical protein
MKAVLVALVLLLATEHCSAKKVEVDVDGGAQQQEVKPTKVTTKAANTEKPADSGSASLEAIDGELLETEALIAAQEKKVNLLQVLRREYLSGKR